MLTCGLLLVVQMLVVSFVFNIVRGAIGAASGGGKSKSQDWDDL